MMVRSWSVLLLLLYLSHVMASHPREIFKIKSDDPLEDEEELENEERSPCHIEYCQVMKRVIGTCINLGKTDRGCVAGKYLHPFHPECM